MPFYKQLNMCFGSHINIDINSLGCVILFIVITIQMVQPEKRSRININSFGINADKTLNIRNIICSKYIKNQKKYCFYFRVVKCIVHRVRNAGRILSTGFWSASSVIFVTRRRACFLLVYDLSFVDLRKARLILCVMQFWIDDYKW